MFKVMGPAIFAVILAPIIAPIGGLMGSGLGRSVGLGFPLGLLGFFGPLLVAAVIYSRSIAVLMLNVGLFIKFGPGDGEDHEKEIRLILKKYTMPFAFYICISGLASCTGIICCCVGIFITSPYVAVAMYVGTINILGIKASDIEKFLVQ